MWSERKKKRKICFNIWIKISHPESTPYTGTFYCNYCYDSFKMFLDQLCRFLAGCFLQNCSHRVWLDWVCEQDVFFCCQRVLEIRFSSGIWPDHYNIGKHFVLKPFHCSCRWMFWVVIMLEGEPLSEFQGF